MDINLNTLCVKWDFDEFTKNYYFCKYDLTGGLYSVDYLTFSNFNLICTSGDSCIDISQAQNNCTISISDSSNSFLFFKNEGPCDLYFKFSSLPINSGFIDFCCYKNSGVYFFQKCNYLLRKNESVFLSLDVDVDGSKYFSKACYGFGFFYDILNINSLVSDSSKWTNVGIYTDTSGLFFPIKSYEENFNGILQCGECSSFIISEGSEGVYFCNFNDNQNLYLSGYNSLVFNGSQRLKLICDPNSGNYDFFNFSGCFNFEIVATPNDISQERILIGKGGGDNGWGPTAHTWYIGYTDIYGPGIAMSDANGWFNVISFPLIDSSGSIACLNTGCFYHVMFASDACCFSIYIDGIRQGYVQCTTCNIIPCIYPSNTNNCNLMIGGNSTNCLDRLFCGNIRSIKYSTGQFPYALDASGNFTAPTGGLTCESGTLFLLQSKEVNVEKSHKYSLCLNVLSGSVFDINFCKTGFYEIKCQLSNITNYGHDFISGNTKINNVSIYDQNGILSEDIYQNGYCFTVDSDKCMCIYFNLSSNNSKIYNFYYLNSGDQSSSNQCVFSENCILCNSIPNNSIQNYQTSFADLNLKIKLCDGFSIKNIKNKSVDRMNLYLPTKNYFLEDYCFSLGNSNYCYNTGISGYWNECFSIQTGYFLNCLEFISDQDNDFLTNCSDNFYISLDFFESRKNTNSIVCKSGANNSEPYDVYFLNTEKIFCYSGLEYKYNPIERIVYKNSDFLIDGCLNITLQVTGKSISFDFPLDAINYQSLRIADDNEIIDYIENTVYNLSYSGICFNYSIPQSNFSCFNFPKIRNENLCGVESPQIDITINSCLKLQNNLRLYLDPYRCFSDDLNYGLNNLLFFIISELNNGLVYCCSYSGMQYGTSEYNLLMLELKDEFYTCCLKIPSGSGSFLINEKISLSDFNYNSPISFKNITGVGYNYIMPLVTGFYFYESGVTNNNSGYINEINYGSEVPLNFSSYSFCISGGSTGLFCFFDQNANLTGSGILFNTNSSVFLNQNFLDVSFTSCDISETQSGKNIFIKKSFDFSGVQPINITSNYNLLCLSGPIKTTNFCNYVPDETSNCVCSIFYYIYNINNPVNSKIKIFSPESTYISTLCWNDEVADNVITSLSVSTGESRLSCNIAFLKFKLNNMIHENQYNFNIDPGHFICLDIRGEI